MLKINDLEVRKSETTIQQIVCNNTTNKEGIHISSALNQFFVKVGGQSEFDPIKHMTKAVANQQSFALSQITSTVKLLIKSLKSDKRGGSSGMPAMIYKIIIDFISYPLAILINQCYDTSIFPDCIESAVLTPISGKENKKTHQTIERSPYSQYLSKKFEFVMIKPDDDVYQKTQSVLRETIRQNHY